MFYTDSFQPCIKQYLQHFGISVNADPNPELLASLARSFSHIPYENLTKMIKKEEGGASLFRLPNEVWEDYRQLGTGGTCFSLTLFLYHLLKRFNFVSYVVMADRSYGQNTHCCLMVLLDQKKYLLDPGFLIDRPLIVDANNITQVMTSFNQLILEPQPNDIVSVWTIQNNQRKLRYQIKDQPVSWESFSSYWKGSFEWSGLNHVIVTKVIQNQQIYMRDHHLRLIEHQSLKKQSMTLTEMSELSRYLKIDERVIKSALELVQSNRGKGRLKYYREQ